MDLRALHRVSVADQVASVLRQRILNGEFRPGVALQEVPLASSLGVSRNTMREALKVLSLEGLLKRSIHRGVTVAELSLNDLQEIYQLRRMFELSAVAAAKTPSPKLIEELRALVDDFEAAARARDWPRAVGIDLQFHTRLLRFHNNRRLELFYQKVLSELRMGMVLVDRSHDSPERVARVHRRIFQLLSAGKLKQCSALLAQHLADSETRVTKVIGNHGKAAMAKGAG
ncbi:MAG: GntR family transcriptional regulator [Acidobacteria bacterium]|nr:GntR family transcriptional regulator [Acidobacteriaceae bacterium]MBV9609144.1 GntR family transcriptional regulator [Acidobacteriota bacterium]